MKIAEAKKVAEKERLSDAEIYEIYKKNEKEGKEKMIEKYSDYAYFLINKNYPSYAKSMQDMYQNAIIGMLLALKTYNPEKGAFTTHCTPYMKKEIGKQVRFLSGEKSEYFATINTKVSRAKTSLELDGEEITEEAVMQRTGLSRKVAKREMNIDHIKVSIDELYSIEGNNSVMSDDTVCNDIMTGLSDEAKIIIKMSAVEKYSFREIADVLNSSENKVRKIYKTGIDMLRNQMMA